MKSKILITLISVLVVIKCSSDISDPDETVKRTFLDLPAGTALGDTTKFDNYYMIHGSYGTTIQFNRQFAGGPFGQYNISASLFVEAGTIPASDSLLCQLSVYVKNTCVHIFPIEQFFSHPFKLTIKYTGLDLQGINLSDLQFVLLTGSSDILDVTYDAVSIDYVTGTLEIINAVVKYDPKIDPDTKYGWVRKAE